MAIIELNQQYPKISIIIISVIVSLFITLVNYIVMDKVKMRESKERQKQLNQQIKAEKDHNKKMELSQELMKHAMENMKHSFKPMLITFIPIILVLWFIKDVYSSTAIAKSWIWYYIIAAIITSLALRKLFKLP